MVKTMKWLLLCVKIYIYIHGSTINSNRLYKEIGIAVYLTQAHKSCFPEEKIYNFKVLWLDVETHVVFQQLLIAFKCSPAFYSFWVW